MIEKDLFTLQAELQQNHLNDVRDAQKALAQEWKLKDLRKWRIFDHAIKGEGCL